MGIRRGEITTDIVRNGLVFNMDAANRASYVPNAITSFNTIDLSTSGSLKNDTGFVGLPTSSFTFDGTDEYIECSNDNATDPQTNYSINAWVKLSSIGRQHSLLEKYDNTSSQGSYAFRINTANKFQFFLIIGTGYRLTESSSALSADIWYNLCCTQNFSTSTGIVYINGIQDNQSTNMNIGPATSNNPLKIGARGNDNGTKLQGNLACAHIYNRALSAEEVLRNYNGLKGRFGL